MQTNAVPAADNPAAPTGSTAPYVWLFRALIASGCVAAFSYGGPISKSIAIAAGMFALWGDIDGLVRHAARIFNLTVAIIAAPVGAALLSPWMVSSLGWSPLAASIASGGATALTVLILLGIIARMLTAGIRRTRHLNSVNRIFGGLLGAGEGAVLVAACCWAFGSFEPAFATLGARIATNNPAAAWIPQQVEHLSETIEADPAGAWLNRHNPLAQSVLVDTTRDVATVLGDPDATDRIADDPRVKSLFNEPAVRRHVTAFDHDPQTRDWMRERDFSKILASPQFASMVHDPELHLAISRHWTDLRSALADAAAAASIR